MFPLEARASISSFYATVDGKKIIGKLFEKEKAKDTYDVCKSGGGGGEEEEETGDREWEREEERG